MESLNARVAAVVRAQAGVKGWSTNRLAGEAGEPTPNVRRYFWTGERPIPLDALEKVAGAFGWSLSELLRRAEAADPEPFVEPQKRPKTVARGFVGKKPQVGAKKLRQAR